MKRRTRRGLLLLSSTLMFGLVVAGPASAAPPSPVFQLPFECNGKAAVRTAGHLPAVDIVRNPENASIATKIVASAAGTVTIARFHPGSGNMVQINHGNGWFTTYIHLRDLPLVHVNDVVAQGRVLGYMGKTGTEANGITHLHYEQAYDSNGDGTVSWGSPDVERVPVSFNGVGMEPWANQNQEKYVTSANCPASGSSLGIGLFRPSTHTWFAPGTVIRSNWGNVGDQPLVGDWDGDGEPGLAVFRASTKTWYTPGHTWMTNWGEVGDQAVGGDFNGDGKDEPALFRASTKTWYTPGHVLRSNWGELGDKAIAGDFDGDGKDEIGVFRPSTKTWYTPGRTLAVNWGELGDKPIAGDFDGDGNDEIGVFRESNKTWYTPGRIMRQNWGEKDDLPVAGL